MDLREVAAAYQSVYLKEEVVEETTEISLSEEEISSIVEEAIDSLLEEGFSIEEIEELSEEIEESVLTEAMTPKQKEMRAKFKAQQAKDDAATTASKNAELRRQKVEAAKDKVKSAVKAKVDSVKSKAKDAVTKYVDEPARKYAEKTGVVKSKSGKTSLGGGEGISSVKFKQRTPEGRREVRKAVAKDVVDRVKTKVKDKAKAVVDDTKETGKAAAKLGKDAAKGVVGAVKDAASAAKSKVKRGIRTGALKLARAMKEEGGELDSFDTVITYLIDEELASTFEEANALMTKLSAETISEIHESQIKYITEISAQLAHTASMKADEVARKARISGDKETAAKKVQQASRIYKGVGPRRAKERMEKGGY